ncbi:efflux RND transporter periplasmic adaptor subunit [Pseudomarimonas arenosa]|uniref:Efflux RND transporter periplasmic adaptor subunit n=1 Tax=Pseudomarimonas arenosa TaxID=2774145 RepID=A0AAW3ZK80_9GAMM|nr:efflux RND transporter periplasmic adaptor subunit [Pseudomarimonas arenosa]MBD8526163.1 efflux RND transporter periplasmic adaptor subunit [Pseudomarimonas arenosa]
MRVFLFAALLALGAASPCAAAEFKTARLSDVAPASRHEFTAVVISANDSQLASEVGAVVRAIHADVGTKVVQGQLLIELDPRDAELGVQQASAQLAAADAQLLLAEQRLQRGKELDRRDFIADDELLALDTQVRAAQAERAIRVAGLAAAKRQREKCTIRAPFDGVVQARTAQVGALAMPGAPMLRIVATGGPEVEAALPDGLIGAADAGFGFAFHYRGSWLSLRLVRHSEVVDPNSRSRLARFEFIDAPAPAGSSGTLRIDGQGFALPPSLVIERNGQRGAFVVENGTTRFRAIDGALPGRSAQVDWPGSTLIVTEGQRTAEDGQAIVAEGAE